MLIRLSPPIVWNTFPRQIFSGALAELNRCCRRSLFVRIATKVDRDSRWHLSIHNRDWWEQQFFQAGFRKHPRYYAILPYEELEHEAFQITIVMEKQPLCIVAYRAVERIDLRFHEAQEIGGRIEEYLKVSPSNPHILRWQISLTFVMGRIWLEVGEIQRAIEWFLMMDIQSCNGSAFRVAEPMLSEANRSRSMDGNRVASESARAYAAANFAAVDSRLVFRDEVLDAAIPEFTDASFDLVTALNSLDPSEAMLAGIHRILRPGGRAVIRILNSNWQQKFRELSDRFIADDARQQSRPALAIGIFDPVSYQQHDSEWCIVSVMKSPRDSAGVPAYQESVFANVAMAQSPVGRYPQSYENPWLVHSMVHIGYRLHSPSQLGALAWRSRWKQV